MKEANKILNKYYFVKYESNFVRKSNIDIINIYIYIFLIFVATTISDILVLLYSYRILATIMDFDITS